MKNLVKTVIILFSILTSLSSNTLNLSMTSSPSRLNPILANDSASSEISNWLFSGLFKYDKNGNVVVDLAKSYTIENKTKLIVNLREDVLWHDGAKFTSKDVVFTYDSIKNPKIFTTILSNFIKVKSVKAIDDYTVEIIYSEPYFKTLEVWMVGILPYHIYKDEKDMMKSKFNKNPVGTGSYKLKTFRNSEDIRLIANDDHYEGRPKIDEILYTFLPDPTTSFLMLKQNKLDLGSLSPLQIDRQIDDKFKKEHKIFEKQSFGYTYLGFNLRNKKFKDLRVRQALSMAIDRKELVDILYFGHAKVCHGPFLPGTFAFDKNVISPSQDLEKAKKLLREAGYDKNNPFSFEVVTNTGNDIRINAAQIIQYQLEKVGVHMKIRVMEWQAFLNTVVLPKKFEAVVLGWGLSIMPDAYSIWHSSSDKKGGFNFVGYKNKKVDELIERGATTINRDKLGIIYKQIFKHISEDIPYLFLYIPNSITVVNDNIKNVEPAFVGITHNQKDWVKP